MMIQIPPGIGGYSECDFDRRPEGDDEKSKGGLTFLGARYSDVCVA